MGPLIAAAIPAVASLIGGIFNNKANAKQARKAEQFSQAMSDTSVQRRVDDLKAAGLNPGIAYSQQASSPTGIIGQQDDVVGPAVSSAMEGARQNRDNRRAESLNATQIKLMQEQQGAAKSTNALNTAMTNTENAKTDQQRLILEQMKILNPTTLARAAADLDSTQTKTLLDKMLIPGMANARDFDKMMGVWGPGLKYGTGLAGDILGLGGKAKGLLGIGAGSGGFNFRPNFNNNTQPKTVRPAKGYENDPDVNKIVNKYNSTRR